MRLGTFRSVLTLWLVVCVTWVVASGTAGAQTNPFTDIGGSYAQKQILDLYARGVVSGKGKGLFDPHAPITRAEFVTMMERALGVQPLNSPVPSFHDVSRDYWAYPYVQAGTALGIVSGTGPDVFQPMISVKRQEVAAFLVRALERNQAGRQAPGELPFADAAAISPWARLLVAEASRLGLMKGDAVGFRPLDPITRAETAVVLWRVLQDPRWINAQLTSARAAQIQLGWQYNQPVQEFEQRVQASGVINTVAPRWFFLEANGAVSDVAEPELVTWAHANGKRVWALVGNHFDKDITHEHIGSLDARAALVEQLLSLAETYHLDGLNIDFEGFYPEDRDNFSAFIAELGTAMRDQGLTLSVDVPPTGLFEWIEPFDFALIGGYADYVVLMGYDEHWVGHPRPGSVSSLSWYQDKMDQLIALVPAQKVIAGLPLYTRDWYERGGRNNSTDLLIPAQIELLQRTGAKTNWDPGTGQYVARYTQIGVEHTIWVEDSRSLAQKLQVGLDHGVAGHAYWHMGGDTPDVWKSLLNSFNYKVFGQ